MGAEMVIRDIQRRAVDGRVRVRDEHERIVEALKFPRRPRLPNPPIGMPSSQLSPVSSVNSVRLSAFSPIRAVFDAPS